MRLAIASLMLLAASPALAQAIIYDASPRIIQVLPQVSTHRAAAPAALPAAPGVDDDDDIIERIEQRKKQARRPFWKSTPEPTPRAELPPPASESRRAVLNAPPTPDIGPGSLTPVYPTPRWRNADPPPPVTADNNE